MRHRKDSARRLLGALVIVLWPGALAAGGDPPAELRPFDEAVANPGLVAYRDRLLAAVEFRDFAALQPFLDPDIKLSFGGHEGLEDARALFRDRPGLWDELARVLRSGGGFHPEVEPESRLFVAPYTFFAHRATDLDPFELVVATGERVPVHAAASAQSEVLARVDYEILPIDLDSPFDQPWLHVKLADGRVGYVERDRVAFPAGYRAGFQKIDGEWRMIFFLAGD
jgi:hypothetical protein